MENICLLIFSNAKPYADKLTNQQTKDEQNSITPSPKPVEFMSNSASQSHIAHSLTYASRNGKQKLYVLLMRRRFSTTVTWIDTGQALKQRCGNRQRPLRSPLLAGRRAHRTDHEYDDVTQFSASTSSWSTGQSVRRPTTS